MDHNLLRIEINDEDPIESCIIVDFRIFVGSMFTWPGDPIFLDDDVECQSWNEFEWSEYGGRLNTYTWKHDKHERQ